MSRLKTAYDASLDSSNHIIPGTPLYPQDYFKQRDPELLKKNKEMHDKQQYMDFETITKPTMTANRTRIRKISELLNGVMQNNEMLELYKNPTDTEIDIIKKTSMDNGVRGVIYDDGTIYAWSSDILHQHINNYIPGFNIDIENSFRFAGYSDDSWTIDVHDKHTVNETIELINKHKDILTRFGNINQTFDIFFASGKPRDYKYNIGNVEQNKKVSIIKSRLRKVAELIDGFMYNSNQFELYKNPTDKEVKWVKEESRDQGVRGVIYDDGTIYIWPSDILHGSINGKLPSAKVDIENSFRFAGYPNERWIMDAHAKYTVNETIELIKKYKDILNRFGNTTQDFVIYYAKGDLEHFEYNLQRDNSPEKDKKEREERQQKERRERKEREQQKIIEKEKKRLEDELNKSPEEIEKKRLQRIQDEKDENEALDALDYLDFDDFNIEDIDLSDEAGDFYPDANHY
jgi:hypothetical protein